MPDLEDKTPNAFEEKVFEDGATVRLWVSDMNEVCITLADTIVDGEVHLLPRNARAIAEALLAMVNALDEDKMSVGVSLAKH